MDAILKPFSKSFIFKTKLGSNEIKETLARYVGMDDNWKDSQLGIKPYIGEINGNAFEIQRTVSEYYRDYRCSRPIIEGNISDGLLEIVIRPTIIFPYIMMIALCVVPIIFYVDDKNLLEGMVADIGIIILFLAGNAYTINWEIGDFKTFLNETF